MFTQKLFPVLSVKVSDTYSSARDSVQLYIANVKIVSEISLAENGILSEVPSHTPNGIEVVVDDSLGFNAIAFYREQPEHLKQYAGKVAFSRKMASCKSILNAALLHEEGHIVTNGFVFPNSGITTEQVELMADNYMLERITRKEGLAFLCFLTIVADLFKRSGEVEAHMVNVARINNIKSFYNL